MRVYFHRIRVLGLCLMMACVLTVGLARGANGDAERALKSGLAVAGGKVYLATGDGKLTCYGSR